MSTEVVKITALLNQQYSSVGDWVYDPCPNQWKASDGATVHWVWVCFSYCDDDDCSHPSELWLYGRGTPQRVWL